VAAFPEHTSLSSACDFYCLPIGTFEMVEIDIENWKSLSDLREALNKVK
jgi:hypothetical protein